MKQFFFLLVLCFSASVFFAQETLSPDKHSPISDSQFSDIQPVIKSLDGLAENCSVFTSLTCGSVISSTTAGAGNDFVKYAGNVSGVSGVAFNGQDRLFQLIVNSQTNLHIVLESAPGVNLDLMLLTTCNPANVVFASTEDNGLMGLREVIDVNTGGSGTLYIMVDSKSAAIQGSFKLSVNCACDCAEPAATQPNGNKMWGDDFKDYANGRLAPQSTRWQLWSTTAQDALVTQEGTNKIAFFNGTTTSQPDVYYHTSNLSSGRYRMSWRMKINNGKKGYYNILHGLPNSDGQNAVWAAEVSFLGTGQGELKVSGTGSAVAAKFAYKANEWLNVVNIIDIDKDVAELWIGDNFVHSWRFSLNSASTTGNKTLAGIDFYAANGNAFYVDNLCIWQKKTSCITTLELNPVCTEKGEQYSNPGSARCDLYTIGEYGSCTDVCDFGGDFIDRGVTYSGKLETGEEAPSSLKKAGSACNALSTQAALFADIYTFVNDQKQANGQPEEITIRYKSTDPTLRCNVFTCQNPYTGAALDDPFCIGSVSLNNGLTIDQSGYKPDIFYYIVFSGALGATYSDFSIIPNGYCPSGAETLTMNATTQGVIGPGTGNPRFSRTGDAYKSCYSGTRTYTGQEKVYQFTLTTISDINLKLNSASSMSMFLYSYLCGGTCLNYAETNAVSDGNIVVKNLAPGTYYLVVDRNSTLGNANFTISAGVSLVIFTIQYCNDGPGNPDNHNVTVPLTAYPFVKEDNVVFVYQDETNKLKETKVEPIGSAIDAVIASMTATIGTPKCGYDVNEAFKVFLSQQTGSNRKFQQMNLAFVPRNVNGNTAENLFEKGKRSTIENMTINTVAHFGTETTSATLQSGATYLRLRFSTNKKWKTEILGNAFDDTPVAVSWLTVTPNTANGAVVVTISAPANTNPDNRTLFVRFYAEDQPYVMRHTVQITQLGKNSAKSGEADDRSASMEASPAIHLMPNPTTGRATLQLNLPQAAVVEVRLLDMTGRMVEFLQTPETMEGHQIFDLDLNQYPTGLYRIVAKVDGQPLHQTLSLQR